MHPEQYIFEENIFYTPSGKKKDRYEECLNCGVYRHINDNFEVQRCPNCGDEEYSLTEPNGIIP